MTCIQRNLLLVLFEPVVRRRALPVDTDAYAVSTMQLSGDGRPRIAVDVVELAVVLHGCKHEIATSSA